MNHAEPVARRIRAFLGVRRWWTPPGRSGYWSIRTGSTVHTDLAWSYDSPSRQLLPIAGMVAFYNEKVDIFLDGHRLERPQTHFFQSDDNRTARSPQETGAKNGTLIMSRTACARTSRHFRAVVAITTWPPCPGRAATAARRYGAARGRDPAITAEPRNGAQCSA